MNSLINLTPFSNFDPLRRLFDESFATAFDRTPAKAPQWVPAVDISEDDKAYEFHFDLPQHDKADLKVGVNDGVLTVSGERKFQREIETQEKPDKSGKKRVLRMERSFGSFSRSFSLPEDVDATNVEATYKDGVLLVKIAKNEKAIPKAIEVKIN